MTFLVTYMVFKFLHVTEGVCVRVCVCHEKSETTQKRTGYICIMKLSGIFWDLGLCRSGPKCSVS